MAAAWPVPLGGTDVALRSLDELLSAGATLPASSLPGARDTPAALANAAYTPVLGVRSALKPRSTPIVTGRTPTTADLELLADFEKSGAESTLADGSTADGGKTSTSSTSDVLLAERLAQSSLQPSVALDTTLRRTLQGDGDFSTRSSAGSSYAESTESLSLEGEGGYAMMTQSVTAVGRLVGYPGVSNAGTATYTIPLWVPPGVRGMSPSLALSYAHTSGNGLLGVGWNLAGLSAITRCEKTVAQDGAAGSIKLDAAVRTT